MEKTKKTRFGATLSLDIITGLKKKKITPNEECTENNPTIYNTCSGPKPGNSTIQ